MINAIAKYQFMQNALIASLLASIVCGIIGVIIVEKKLTMMSGGIAHAAYGGVGLGYYLGTEPMLGAFIFSMISGLGIGFIKRKFKGNTDIAIALFWSLGMALGLIFIAVTPGYPPDMSSYLFGNILTVTRSNIKLMLVITLIILVLTVILFPQWKAFLFDQEFATIIGIKTAFMEYLLLIMISMAIVALINTAGIILVLALLTAPAAVSALFTKYLKKRIVLSVLLSCIFCIAGLWISFLYNIPSGASIVLISVAVYILTAISKGLYNKLIMQKFICRQESEAD